MQLLTPTGYKNIDDCVIGEQLVAYDINDGSTIVNQLLGKQWFSPDMFEDEYSTPEQAVDDDGNLLYEQVVDENGDLVNGDPIMTERELIKTKEQIFIETYGDLKFYTINGTHTYYANQSVWANMNVTHAYLLQVGDIIYDDNDQDITITNIEEVSLDGWWRLTVSGDHSYIADGITLHNASRYWVGGGSANTWVATANTNWGSTSGGSNNASVPTSADDVTFDGAGTNGNTASTISATITILSLNITTGYTSTMTHNAVLTIAGSVTLSNAYTITGTSGIIISSTSTVTPNSNIFPNNVQFSAITVTLAGNWDIGSMTATTGVTLNGLYTITIQGNTNLGTSGAAGTATLLLKGGTLTTGAENTVNMSFDGNVTMPSQLTYKAGTIKYISGTISGNTLWISSASTIDVNGITWANLIFSSNSATCTLVSDLTTTGSLTISNSYTINTSTGAKINVANGLTISSNLFGTAKVILTGGTWSGSAAVSNNLDLQGNITVSGSVQYGTNTLTYVSGTITTTSSTLTISGSTATLNTSGITWNNITSNSTTKTITLTSNLSLSGLLTISGATTLNRTTAETVTVAGGITVSAALSGTAKVILTGGTWSGTSTISNDLDLQGNVTIFQTVSYSTGTLKYVSGTITTLGSALNIQGSCTINTSGVSWYSVVFAASNTTTLSTDLIVTDLLSTLATTTLNGYTVTIGNGLTVRGTTSGTTKIILTGGIWSGNAYIYNNTDIQGNITISGTVYYYNGTLTYISGTVTTTSSTLTIQGTCTLNTSGITWNNLATYSATTATLTSDLLINGTLSTASNNAIINQTTSQTVTVYNGITLGRSLTGTAKIILKGGTWSGNQSFTNPFDIDGNITVSGFVYYGSNTITYLSGVITTSGSTLGLVNNATLNTNGITWNNILSDVTRTYTLISNLTCSGSLTVTAATVFNTSNSSIFYISGGITVNAAISGTAKVVLTGGTWSGGSTLSNSLDINGNAIISGSVYYGTGTLSYLGGTVTTTGSTLNIAAACTLNTSSMQWNTIVPAGYALTLSSSLRCNTLSIGDYNQTFSGTAGFVANTLNCSSLTSRTITLASGQTYSVKNAFTCNASRSAILPTFTSSSGTTKSILNLDYGCDTNLMCNFTRIDASGGRRIYGFNSTVTDCTNVYSFNDLKTIASGYSSVMS